MHFLVIIWQFLLWAQCYIAVLVTKDSEIRHVTVQTWHWFIQYIPQWVKLCDCAHPLLSWRIFELNSTYWYVEYNSSWDASLSLKCHREEMSGNLDIPYSFPARVLHLWHIEVIVHYSLRLELPWAPGVNRRLIPSTQVAPFSWYNIIRYPYAMNAL